jgi:hypothetical protein
MARVRCAEGQELKLTVPYFEADKSVVPTSLCFLPNEPQVRRPNAAPP